MKKKIVRWKNPRLVEKGNSGWKFARSRRGMPRQSGRYLFMDELGVFFFGYWDSNERRLYTQCVQCLEDGTGRRETSGQVQMASWNWHKSGRVFWKDVGEPSYYGVYGRAKGERKGPRYRCEGSAGEKKGPLRA